MIAMKRGKFITVEGGEGVGKSTQIAAIRDAVERAGLQAVVTREPGGTPRAETIRELLLQTSAESMPQACELLLMFAARSTHIANVIDPALARGAWVICDRFTDATYAYQGGGRGVPMQTIATLEHLVQQGLKPDLTVLLDAPVELALNRARSRNGTAGPDRFEREQVEFFDRVRRGYAALAAENPERIRVIDSAADVETVRGRVRAAVETFINSVNTTAAHE
jgi:dTMP kinase